MCESESEIERERREKERERETKDLPTPEVSKLSMSILVWTLLCVSPHSHI